MAFEHDVKERQINEFTRGCEKFRVAFGDDRISRNQPKDGIFKNNGHALKTVHGRDYMHVVRQRLLRDEQYNSSKPSAEERQQIRSRRCDTQLNFRARAVDEHPLRQINRGYSLDDIEFV